MFLRSIIFLVPATSAIAQGFLHEVAECSKIVGFSAAATVIYAVAQNQITVRLSPEHFSLGLARRAPLWNGPILSRLKIFLEKTKYPTAVASIWGLLQFPIGLILAVPIVLVSRVGSWPKIGAPEIIFPSAIALSGMSITVMRAGIRTYTFMRNVKSSNPYSRDLPVWSYVVPDVERAAYLHGMTAGLGLAAYLFARRACLIDDSGACATALLYLLYSALPSFA